MYIIYTFKKLLKNCSKCVTGTANEDNSMAKLYEKHHSCSQLEDIVIVYWWNSTVYRCSD